MNTLNLERMNKTLGDYVIPTIALTAHATDKAMLGQYGFVIVGRVLATPIRMADQPLTGVAP